MNEEMIFKVINKAEEKFMNICESTIKKKIWAITIVFRFITEFNVSELNRFFNTYIGKSGKELSINTKNTIKAEMIWLINNVFEIKNRVEFDKVLRKQKGQSAGKKIDISDLFRVIDNSDTKMKFALKLMYNSGMRPHELISIKKEDIIKTETGIVVNIPEVNNKIPSKRNKTGSRKLIIFDFIQMDIDKYMQNLKKGDYLFSWKHGVLSTKFSNLKLQLNVDFRLYDLRHSFATNLANSGFPSTLLNTQMGWDLNSKMPSIYIHHNEKDIIRWKDENMISNMII